MKRQRVSRAGVDDGSYPYIPNPVMYGMPALESTVLIETLSGGAADRNSLPNTGVGNNIIPIDTSIRGCKSLQYDGAIWQNDIFTYNYSNCLIGLVVGYAYQDLNVTTDWHLTVSIVPLPVARGKRVILKAQAGGDEANLYYSDVFALDESEQKSLGDNLAYELNCFFMGQSNGRPTALPSCLVMTNRGVTWQNDEYFFPIFRSTVSEGIFGVDHPPPILFKQFPSNNGNGGILTVYQNPQCIPLDANYSYVCGFNFINIREYMENPWKHIRGSTPYSMFAYKRDCVTGESKGWTGGGPHVFGIGTWDSTTSLYVDDYQEDHGRKVFNYSADTLRTYSTFGAVKSIFKTHHLKQGVCCLPRALGFCPSRYYYICTDAITRNQKIPFLTNVNAAVSPAKSCVALIYANYLASHNSSPANHNQAYPFSDKYPVIGMRDNENRASIDWQIIDENGNTVQTLDPANRFQYRYFLNFERGVEVVPHTFQVPPYFAANLNPNPTLNPNGDPLCGIENVNQNIFCITSKNPTVREDVKQYNPLDDEYAVDYMLPCSSKWTHFIRAFGKI